MLIAARRKKDFNYVQFRCVDVDRKGQMSAPYVISVKELNEALKNGEDIRRLLKAGCSWDIGEKVNASDNFDGLTEF